MIEIIHVSDLHFGRSDERNDAAIALLNSIKQAYPFNGHSDRYLLVTGDITHNAEDEQYAIASEELSYFTGKLLLTPGNHDWGHLFGADYDWQRAQYFDNPFAAGLNFNHAFYEKHAYTLQLVDETGQAKLQIIGLNSCTRLGLIDFAQGKIGRNQRIELKDQLDQCDPQVPRLVYLHHIPHKPADFPVVMTLKDRIELMDIVKNNVDALAFGHQGKKPLEVGESSLSEAPPRSMGIRSIDAEHRRTLLLDANHCVEDQKFYVVTVDASNTLTAKVCPA